MKTKRKTKTGDKVRKGISMVLILAMSMLMLIGCSGNKLSEDFDEDKVKAAAQEAIDHLVAGEYEECVALMSDELQAAVSAEVLVSNMETVNGQKGVFQEYKSIAVVGQTDKDGTEYAVVVIVAAFEKGNMTFTVSFDKEMNMIGLWMK